MINKFIPNKIYFDKDIINYGENMDRKHNKELTANAKVMRKNMTKEERHLWYDFLRTHPVRFSRQKILGRYIVGFYSSEAKLVIDLDGSQHFEKSGQQYDAKRDAYLRSFGICIIRIPNNEINFYFAGVCDYLEQQIKQRQVFIEAPTASLV